MNERSAVSVLSSGNHVMAIFFCCCLVVSNYYHYVTLDRLESDQQNSDTNDKINLFSSERSSVASEAQ